MVQKLLLPLLLVSIFNSFSIGQHQDHHPKEDALITAGIEPQPLLAQAIRLKEALSFLGSSLTSADEKRLAELQLKPHNQETVKQIQKILDPYCLVTIDINPESRVKVGRGAAKASLIQNGWVS